MYRVTGSGGAVVGGGALAHTGASFIGYLLMALGLLVAGLLLYRFSAVRHGE